MFFFGFGKMKEHESNAYDAKNIFPVNYIIQYKYKLFFDFFGMVSLSSLHQSPLTVTLRGRYT